MQDLQKNYVLAAEVLEDAMDEIKALLSDPNSQLIYVGIHAALQKQANRLHFLGGSTPKHGISDQEYKPITEFMGEKIEHRKEVNFEDLEPGEADRLQYVEKVNSLYAELPTLSLRGVLHSMTITDDILVLRGVAKKAGMQDFEDAVITEEYLEKVVKAINERNAFEAQEKSIHAQLEANKQKAGEAPVITGDSTTEDEDDYYDEEMIDVVVTQQILDMNPVMAEQGIKLGDIIQVTKEGGHFLHDEFIFPDGLDDIKPNEAASAEQAAADKVGNEPKSTKNRSSRANKNQQ
jgi:hypothetical protein